MADISKQELKSIFNSPPEKVIDFFEAKGLKTSFDWHEVYADAHAKAFTIAKMTELDLLKDTKSILDKSIKEGASLNRTEKELKELFAKKGWTGFKEMKDPKTGRLSSSAAPAATGETRTVELGTPRRVRTIAVNNMNTACAAGRYLEQMEEADIAPYWQYMCILDESTRQAHRDLHQKVFKCTDQFWQNFYPPNGWNCRCFVRNLTKSELDRAGYTVEKTDGAFSTITKEIGGEMKEIPVFKYNDGGIEKVTAPDAGWETNIGKAAWKIDAAAWGKVKDVPEQIKYDFLSKMAQNPHREEAFKLWAAGIMKNGLKNTDLEKTLTWVKPEIYEKIKTETPIIVMQSSQIGHSGMNKNDKQALTEDEYLQVYDIINNPDEIYQDFTRPKWQQIAFIRRIKGSDKCIKICVRLNQKSRKKDIDYLVSKITTIGKVLYHNIANGKDYKMIYKK